MNTSEPASATPMAAQPTSTETLPAETTDTILAPVPATTEVPTATTTAEAPQPDTTSTAPAEPIEPAAPPHEKTVEEPEPQNPLTERFTTQEWTALKEFRVREHYLSLISRVIHHQFINRPSSQKFWPMLFLMTQKPRKHLSPSGVYR